MVRRGFVLAGIVGAFVLAGISGGNAARAQSAPPNSFQEKSSASPLVGHRITFTPMPFNGGAVVTLRINDTMEGRFLISTGNPTSVVSPAFVKKLGLPVEYRPEASGTKIPFVFIKKAEATAPTDSLKIIDAPFVVVENGGLDERTDRFYDGVIAANVVSQFAVVFDYEVNKMFLLGGNLNEMQLQTLSVADGLKSGVPMTAYDANDLTFTVPVRVGNNSFPAVISSTSTTTTVLDKDKKLNLDKAGDFSGMASDTPPYLLSVSDFGLGTGGGNQAIGSLKPFNLGVEPSPTPTRAAVLGLDYLTHFRVIIDYPARKFYALRLKNPPQYPFPTEASREAATRWIGGGALRPLVDGKWAFTSIVKEGVLDKAGIQNGDVLETVNGGKANGLSLTGFKDLFHSPRDTEELELLRNNKPVKVVLHWQ